MYVGFGLISPKLPALLTYLTGYSSAPSSDDAGCEKFLLALAAWAAHLHPEKRELILNTPGKSDFTTCTDYHN